MQNILFLQGELFRKMCYLDYLADHFENDVEVIQHIVEVLDSILYLLPANRFRVVMVKLEVGGCYRFPRWVLVICKTGNLLSFMKDSLCLFQHKILTRCVGLLFGQCENSLTRVKRLFTESTTVQGVGMLQRDHLVLGIQLLERKGSSIVGIGRQMPDLMPEWTNVQQSFERTLYQNLFVCFEFDWELDIKLFDLNLTFNPSKYLVSSKLHLRLPVNYIPSLRVPVNK